MSGVCVAFRRLAALLVVCLLLTGIAPLPAQEWLIQSRLTGVTYAGQPYAWADPDGKKAAVLAEIAQELGLRCGRMEFAAWQVAGEPQAAATRSQIESAYRQAGFTLAERPLGGQGTGIAWLAKKADREFLLYSEPVKDGVALLACATGAAGAAGATGATGAAAADSGSAAAGPEAGKEGSDAAAIGLLLLAAVALLGVLLWRRRQARASRSWPTAPATILDSGLATRTSTDDDGDTTVWYSPRLRYAYEVAGQRYESDRLRFGTFETTNEAAARQVLARYPAGATVAARYDPAKPQSATLEAVAETGTQIVLLVVIGLFLLTGLAVVLF